MLCATTSNGSRRLYFYLFAGPGIFHCKTVWQQEILRVLLVSYQVSQVSAAKLQNVTESKPSPGEKNKMIVSSTGALIELHYEPHQPGLYQATRARPTPLSPSYIAPIELKVSGRTCAEEPVSAIATAPKRPLQYVQNSCETIQARAVPRKCGIIVWLVY